LQVGIATIVGSLLFAIVAGLIIFRVLTQRLRNLVDVVRIYREKSFQGRVLLQSPTPNSLDEIDELTAAIIEMSERIEQQFTAIKAVDNTRRELIANVSHDLRTPLASMQGYLETILVKEQKLSQQEQRQYLQIAYKQSCRLNQLISELFELSKLESDSVELDWQAFPLMELIQDLIQDCELEAKERGITLAAHCDDMNICVCGDIALIHRALDNLLQNALRHCSDGGEINFTIQSEDKKVWLEVADNGDGIAPQDIPYIFDRFYRPATEVAKTGGGLGLAIVKRIIELHLSEVAVISEEHKGAAFKFWLPLPA
jgi:signal transduction histidine kinase